MYCICWNFVETDLIDKVIKKFIFQLDNHCNMFILGVFPTQSGQQVYIVATDLNNIPPGSVIIDPRTGKGHNSKFELVYYIEICLNQP